MSLEVNCTIDIDCCVFQEKLLLLLLRFTIMFFVFINNVRVIAVYFTCRGKSMLAQAERLVVFVPGEVISQGSWKRLTAGKIPKSFGYGMNTFKVPQ